MAFLNSFGSTFREAASSKREESNSGVHRLFKISPPASVSDQRCMLFHIVKKGDNPPITRGQVLVPVTEKKFVNSPSLGVSHIHHRWMRAYYVDMLLRFREGAEVAARLRIPKLREGTLRQIRGMCHPVIKCLVHRPT